MILGLNPAFPDVEMKSHRAHEYVAAFNLHSYILTHMQSCHIIEFALKGLASQVAVYAAVLLCASVCACMFVFVHPSLVSAEENGVQFLCLSA